MEIPQAIIFIGPLDVLIAKRAYRRGRPKKQLEKCHHGSNRIGCRICSPAQCRFCEKIESVNRIRVHIKKCHADECEKCECGNLYHCQECHGPLGVEPEPINNIK